MKKGGRPAIFQGCRAQHKRIRFEKNGKHRAFFAKWRPEIRMFEFELSGYGIKPRKFFCPSKGLAVANLRLYSSVSPLNGWKWQYVDESTDWGANGDPIGDWIFGDSPQTELVPVTSVPVRTKDRVKQAQAFFA